MEKLLGGRLFRANSLTEMATVEHDFHMDKRNGAVVREKYDRTVCQCCGYREHKGSVETCLCDGLEWYMLPDGRVECQAHRFARAINGGRKKFMGLF